MEPLPRAAPQPPPPMSSSFVRPFNPSRMLVALLFAAAVTLSSAAPQPTDNQTMSSPEFTPAEVPARIADLAFTYLRPANFQAVPLPDEKPNFEEATTFYPLHLAMASYGAVLLSAAARP